MTQARSVVAEFADAIEELAAADDAASHTVNLPDTGHVFEVEPGESVLAAALRANIHLAHDCKSGTCGSCRIRLRKGEIRYDEPPMGLLPEEEEEGYALACQARPLTDIVAEAEVLDSQLAEPQRHRVRVAAVEPLSDGVTRLVLELPETAQPDYRAGQYADIVLEDGTVRSFSMASSPDGRVVDFHIRRIPGGSFTEQRVSRLAVGDELEVEMPRGAFYFRPDDFRPLLFLATGTGIAPIKSILESLFDDPDCPPVSLYWGGRTEADLYLVDEIAKWGDRLYEFNFVPVLSRGGPEWQGRRGYVQDVALEDIDDISDHAIYLCGSPEMVAGAKRAIVARGGSSNHVYADSFLFQHNLVGSAKP